MADTPNTRAKLKSAFSAGKTPMESDFADLIDGMLNQVDDGLIKQSDTPLQINAVGAATDVQPVINFYEIGQIGQKSPSWSLQLNPVVSGTNKPGFCIADGKGTPRLFIDKATGHIGIGTNTPRAQLEIIADEQSLVGSQKWHDAISLANIDHAAITLPAGGLMFGLHATNKRFYFADYTNTNYIMVIDVVTDVNKTTGVGNATGGVSIGINKIDYKPIATLDIAQYFRTDTHPTAIKGLYVTGNFQADSDGVEFRHTNGTKGIGFGYNTIYATGYDADQDLNLKARGEGVVNVLGIGNISGTNGFKPSGQMLAGSLSIGDTKTAYGGGTSMNQNIAGLLLTTSGNTEIAVNENAHRLASLMYYEGSPTNKITIGRDMGNNTDGYGSTPVTIASDLEVKGNVLVSGGIFQKNDFTIELCGTAKGSNDSDTYIKINNAGINIGLILAAGLNVVILNANGSLKEKNGNPLYANFDVFDNNPTDVITSWNNWADWVNRNTVFGDIVAVVSNHAISNAPRASSGETPGLAEVLLMDIQADNAFTVVATANADPAIPYALLFVKGRKAIEVMGIYCGKNALLKTTYLAILNQPSNWLTATLLNGWKNKNGDFNKAQFYKDSDGFVSLRGYISGGKTPDSLGNTFPIFTLPRDCWPANYEIHSVMIDLDNDNPTLGRIDILEYGAVNFASKINTGVCLDGIRFSASKLLT